MYFHIVILIANIIVPLFTKLLKAFGVGVVSYVGINQVLGQIASYIEAQLGGTSVMLQQIMGLAKIDVAINIVLAAITTRMILAGMNKFSGRKKDFVLKA